MNVPKLRFKEFSGEWETISAKDLFENISEKNFPAETVLTIIQGQGTIPRSESGRDISFDEKSTSNYKKVLKNDFIIHLRSFEAGLEVANSTGIVSPAYTVLRSKEPIGVSFYRNYFRSNKFINQTLCSAVEGVRDGRQIRFEQFKNIPLVYTKLEEQEKISAFLNVVDEKIVNQKAIVKSLEKQKKGLMQKIFSQELRFKDDKGEEFPAWEEKKLGEVCDTFSGGTPSVSNKRFYNGDVPFIKSGEIHNDSTEGFISAEGLKNSSAKIVEEGDLLYALYGANSGDVAISKIKGAINQAILCIRTNELNKEYLCELLGFSRKNLMNTYLQGGQGNFSAEIFKNLKFLFPKKKEQKKIADFLIVYNEKIDNERKVLVRWQQIKKGLLQQMFV